MNKNIIIVFLVLIIGVLAYFQFKPKEDITLSPTTVTPNGQTTTINNSDGKDYQPQTEQNTTWVQDKNTGYFYPQGATLNVVDISSFSLSYKGLTIDLGEYVNVCNANTYTFQYGISTQACVTNGAIAKAYSNTSQSLTTDLKKLFGDFVLKNKLATTTQTSTGIVYKSSSDYFSLSLPTNMNLAEDPIGSGRYYVKYTQGVTPKLPYFRNINVSNEACPNGDSVTINGINYTRVDDIQGGMETASMESVYCTTHADKTYMLRFSWGYQKYTGSAPDRNVATAKFNNELTQLNLQLN